jgi:hypothetical protein
MKPKGWFKDKEYKTNDHVDFEKSKEECTFKPSINDAASLQALAGDQVESIRGVDKVKERQVKAREQALQKKLMTERGVPS